MLNIDKEKLEDLIFNQLLPYDKIGALYNCTGANIRKYAKKFGIELPKRRKKSPKETFNKGKKTNTCAYCGKKIDSINKYCSSECRYAHQRSIYLEQWKNNQEDGMKGKYGISMKIRKYLLEKHNYKCECCGWGETNKYTGNIPLEIHHKDGNYLNNKEENLQVLCPNCHSLTDTYKRHNKKGRYKKADVTQ